MKDTEDQEEETHCCRWMESSQEGKECVCVCLRECAIVFTKVLGVGVGEERKGKASLPEHHI